MADNRKEESERASDKKKNKERQMTMNGQRQRETLKKVG